MIFSDSFLHALEKGQGIGTTDSPPSPSTLFIQ